MSTVLREITSKHHGGFCCLNCLRSLRKDFCGIAMPSGKDKMPYIIYADIASLIKKIDGCANNPENSSTIKIGEHIPCGYSMATIWAFDHIENKHTLYRGKDCMKNFCTSLREHAKNITYFERKRMLPLTREELKLIKMQNYVIFVEKESYKSSLKA